MSQTHLHSKNFDLCRICLFEPESDRTVRFLHVLMTIGEQYRVKDLMLELLGINVDHNDIKPKMICENCYKSLLAWLEIKKKASESEIVINYIASKRLFNVNMPGTSIGSSTPLLMIGSNSESSQESSFQHSQLSQRSNMHCASTSRLNSESSQGSSFQHSQLSQRSNMHCASTSRLNGESSQGSSFQHSQLSQRSNMHCASTSRLNGESSQGSSFQHSQLSLKSNMCVASTSRLNGESSQGSSFQHSQLSQKSNMCVASTSRLNGESSQGSSFRHSQLSQRPNMYGASTSRLSIASTSSQIIINNGESSSFKQSQLISNSGFVDDSDDDSCIEVTTEVPTVDLISDDDDDKDVDSSNYDEDTVILSSDNEENQLTLKNENFNNETEKLYYCSICQKKNFLNHDCSQHTKSFFTCLVPNCNVLSRSKKHFTSHYQLHIGMPSSAVMCNLCFREIEQSNIDRNGCHIHCNAVNAFKCYTCNVRFNGMQEFAFHKLKTHNGLLMDVHGNYLCLHCEESSPEITVINEHMKHCLKNQTNNVSAAKMKLKKPTVNETALLPVKTNKTNVSVRKNRNKEKIPRTSEHILFTCLKPSCNLVFQTFRIFKLHHRSHFNLGTTLMCWQCCKPFNNASHLRAHQVKYNCRTPGMFKCSKCPEAFDDIESFSIHKFTFHDGNLMAAKKNRKTIMCAFCKMDISIFNFQSHLTTCQKKNVNKNTFTNKHNGTYNCLTCGKVFLSSISLSNHSRIHNPSRLSANLKKD